MSITALTTPAILWWNEDRHADIKATYHKQTVNNHGVSMKYNKQRKYEAWNWTSIYVPEVVMV